MTVATVIFLVASVALLHTYAVYPLVLLVIKKLAGHPQAAPSERQGAAHEASQTWPTVSVIIPFHNEEQWVSRKLENTLSWDYPPDCLDVVAISDGSDDGTNTILDRYKGQVHAIVYHPRCGKPTALNLGVLRARGAILIFTDANVLVDPKAIRAMIARYHELSVGGVCGRVVLQPVGTAEPLGEGLYMRYEQWLYDLESRTHTMVGADGAFFSIRRELFTPLPSDTVTDDLFLALEVIAKGKRVVYEPEAVGAETVISNVRAEFCRKVRMIAGGYQSLTRFRYLLNPLRFPLVTFQLMSHKLLRWWAPFFLGALFVSAASKAADDVVFAVALALQCVFYGLAILGWANPQFRRWRVVYLPYYFCATNWAAVQGLWRFLRRRQPITWQKVSR